MADLTWGWPLEAKVDRQQGSFYRLTVDKTHREAGFFLHVRSLNKDKFKLLVFDKDGSLLHSDDCHKHSTAASGAVSTSHAYTYSSLFFTNFATYSMPDAAPAAPALPPVLTRLEGLQLQSKALPEGQYLICVYGDNFMAKTSYTLMALPANSIAASQLASLEETDEKLLELKGSLSQLKSEYLAAKETYEAVCSKVKSESEHVEQLVSKRELLYSELVDGCVAAFAPHSGAEASSASSNALPVGSALSTLSSANSALTGSVHKLASNVNAFFFASSPASSEEAAAEASPVAAPEPSTAPSISSETTEPGSAGASNPLNVLSSNAQAATGWLSRKLSGELI
jgi:hypothetical protein